MDRRNATGWPPTETWGMTSTRWVSMRLPDQLDHWVRERPEGEFAVHGSRTLTFRCVHLREPYWAGRELRVPAHEC